VKNKVNKATILVLSCLLVFATMTTGGCSDKESTVAPPFVPPEYFDCIKVTPRELRDLYFVAYSDFMTVEAQYNDKYFVFKDLTIEDWMFKDIDEGFIWVDLIKCYVVDVEKTKRFKTGDKVDVVGLNAGPTCYQRAELEFVDCIVLPAGSVALPSDPDAATITPGY